MTDVRAVAAAFGLDHLQGDPLPLAAGEQGPAWVVTTPHGRWVLKQLSSERARDRAADAHAFATAAAGKVPIPAALLLDDGSPLLDGTVVGSPGTWFRAMEWLDLEAHQGVEPHELGSHAAAIHRVDCPATRDVESWFSRGVDDDRWEALLDTARAAQAEWLGGLRRRLPALSSLRELTAARPGRPLISHRDLNTSNVCRIRAGEVVVLDWDMCGPVDPRRELALLVVQIEVTDAGSAVPAYRSYLDAGGPARLDALDAFASVSIALDNLIHHYATLLIEEPDSVQARDRLGWLFEAADLANLSWLERLLDRLRTVDG